MKRVEFRLSMPGVGSWDGKWSGSKNNYTIKENLTDNKISILGLDNSDQSWSYNFGDGWCATVRARIVPKGEKLKKSDGFCGYNWMVDSIISNNLIKS